MKSRLQARAGLALMAVAYLAALYWVFTRSTPVRDDRPVTLRIAHWQIELGPPDGIAAVIKRYEELNPHVRVKQVLVPSGVYRQWLRSNLAGDNAPDIVEYGAWLDGLRDLPVRYFEPLTTQLYQPNPYNRGTPLEGRIWLKTFVDELIEQRLNSPEPGQYYCVNLTRGSIRFFCNRELLQAITGSDHQPQTLIEFRQVWAQVADYAARTGRTIHPFAGSRDNAMWLMEFYMGGLMGRLSRELDRDGILGSQARTVMNAYLEGRWDYQRPELEAGLRQLAEFCRQMKPGFLQLTREEAAREFLRGDALFIFAGTWEATSLRRLADFTVDAMRLPQPTFDDPVVGPHILGRFSDGDNTTGFGFYLNKRGPNRAAAVDFLQFLTSYEGSKLFTEQCGWVSGVVGVPVPPEIASYLSPEDGYGYGYSYVTMGMNVRTAFERNLHQLAGPQGDPARMAAALEAAGPGAIRADLREEQRTAWLACLPQDARILALGGLARTGGETAEVELRRARLEAAQNLSEARALMVGRWLHKEGLPGSATALGRN